LQYSINACKVQSIGGFQHHAGQRNALAPSTVEDPDRTARTQNGLPHAHVEFGGVTIIRGEAITISCAAAGRDTALHGDDADRFDVTRRRR
jgi:hypothetical protein